MASTPPLQITATPQTPPTPLHGAAYDRNPTRQSSRIRERTASSTASSSFANGAIATPRNKRTVTPPESRPAALGRHQAPAQTPRKAFRRVQVVSPESPNTELTPPKSSRPVSTHLQPFLSSTTTMSEGMLPTPVKTPKKKEVSNVTVASRALFQDPTALDELAAPSPRKSRKNKRYNGFSLESFRAEDDNTESIQIFTDNRDKVPEVDATEANPFMEKKAGARAQKVAQGSKRRKVSHERPLDSQVQDAIDKDEGMVYVFRGKKVYRRFADDDELEEEEVIDEQDLGLLGQTSADGEPRRSIRTLTRKSIKPTRLFQTEEQKAAREREKEEEAMTDHEDEASSSSPAPALSIKDTKPSKTTGSRTAAKKTSPFDSWGRAKKSSHEGTSSRPGKRSAADAFERGSPGVEVSTKRKARV